MELTTLAVLYGITILLALCIFLFSLLSIRYFFQKRQKKKRDAYYKKTEQLWFEYLIEDGPFTNKLIPKTANEIKSAENILLSYINNISDEKIQSKITFLAKAYLSTYYMKMLTNRRWSNRMNTLYRIVDFRLDNLVDYCMANQEKLKTPNEQFQLFKIQSMFRKDMLLQLLTTPQAIFTETEYKQIFLLMDEDMLEVPFNQFEQLPKKAQYAFIEVFSNKIDFEKVYQLESLLVNEDVEVRIRVLKGIERVGVIHDLNKIIPFVKSAIWEERLMVTKILKHIPLNYAEPYLIELLNDTNDYIQKEVTIILDEEKSSGQFLEKYTNRTVRKSTNHQMVWEGR